MSAYKTYNDFEFHSQNEENMEILVGTNDLNSLGGARYKVKKAIKHEFFYLSEYSQSDALLCYGFKITLSSPTQLNQLNTQLKKLEKMKCFKHRDGVIINGTMNG